MLAPIQETGTDKSTADSQVAPSAGSGGGTDTSELSQGSEENPPPPPPVAAQSNQWREASRDGRADTDTVAGSNPEHQETGTDKSTADSQAAPSSGYGGGTDTSELSQWSEENPPPPPPPEAAQSTQEQPMEAVPEGRADTDTVAGRRLESTADSQAAPSAGSGGGTDTSELSQGSDENPPPPPPPEAAQSTQEQPMEAAPEGRADTDVLHCCWLQSRTTGDWNRQGHGRLRQLHQLGLEAVLIQAS